MYTLSFMKNGKEVVSDIQPEKNRTVLSIAREVVENEVGDPDAVFGIKDSMGNSILTEEDLF